MRASSSAAKSRREAFELGRARDFQGDDVRHVALVAEEAAGAGGDEGFAVEDGGEGGGARPMVSLLDEARLHWIRKRIDHLVEDVGWLNQVLGCCLTARKHPQRAE